MPISREEFEEGNFPRFGRDKASIEQLIEERKQGKTLEEIAQKFGFNCITHISKRLAKAGYSKIDGTVKLSRIGKNGKTRIVSITQEEIKKAGFDPDDELYAKKIPRDGEIIFELKKKR